MPSYGGYNFAEFDQANSDILKPIFQKGISIHDIYEVYDENKAGGLSFVCLCRNKNDKNFYVLKTYNNVGKEEDFKEEIEFALKLEKHPHIVYSQTAFKEKDRLYLVMELVGEEPNAGITIGKNQTINTNNIKRVKTNTGFVYSLYDMSKNEPWKTSTLETELQKGIKINDSFKYAIEFCRGMQYLNSIGMKSHGDIKPSNIFIAKKIKTWIDKENQEKSNNLTELLKASHLKEYKYVKIADFGFATLKKRTRKGWSDYYYSPEHLKDKILDIRSDIYSFGIVLYEMFNAGINLQIKTRTETKLKRKNNFIEVSKIKSKHCNEIIKKCLQPKQKERYQTFKELEKDLLKEAKKEIDKNFEVERLPIEQINAKDYFDKGNGYQNIEKYKEAIKNYNEAIKIDSKYVFAYNNRGSAKEKLEKYEEAIKDYNIAVKLDPNCVFAYYNIGNAKRSLKQYEEAIKYYQMAIKITPNAAYIYNSIGNTKVDLECYEEAIKYYDKALEFNSKYAIAYYARGIVKEKLKKYKEALKDYDTAIKFQLDSQYAYIYHFYNNRGIIKANLNQHEEAIKDYSKAIDLEPRCVQSYYNRGISEKNLKKYKEAIKDFKEVLKCLDKDIDSICMVGNINLELGKYKEAINNYNRIIELNPKYAIAYNNRGNAKYYLKQYEEAIKDYDIAIKIDSKYVSAYSNHGNAKYKLKLYEEAIKDYNKAIEIDNKHISSYKNLIEVYKLLGKEKEAKKVAETLKEISKG